jgi:hypothetical protein
MFERIRSSWELIKASWTVLQSDKELIVFPVISAIGAVLVSILFAVPFLAVGIVQGSRSGEDAGVTAAGYIIGFLFYVVLYTVVFFCNTALVGAALIRLRGGDPTVSDGFRIASERISHIVGYALISATVGMILRAISERGGILGSLVSSIGGFAWNVATFLVVPVLVIENVGPLDAVKRSASLLKKTWGENIIGNVGIGAVSSLVVLLGIFILIGLIMVGAAFESSALIVGAIALFVIFLVLFSLVVGALQGIYQAAVYRYAADGDSGTYFAPELVHQAFKPKRG